MLNKVKKIFYAIASLIAIAPSAVLAINVPDADLPDATLTDIITGFMNWLLAIVGILAVIGFVIAGIIYLTAAGDEDQIARGKKTMIYSLVGIIVALMGVIIIKAVQSMLGGGSSF
ncbi:MAG TPA: hypothetical protein P5548_01240 [Candidatus Moranbacteria bacterium]|nr:hypothetical protein [Candidatus Moranbacteria bacterium]HRZ33516.1 hypothetical protein [Candidatus Moranbacteria bacterium]